ncbi:hypothetical protein J437_LFUL000841 [Ladona fulva]|uniref:Integral membrane protein DGCR2/IDD n=1 Tax=Ladona fulva TaxID=123851 RepID=A0A8K0JUH9_LADFU|nr:hypothetical protein J437_LFUL000841 [Ladona fulva]
MEPGAIDQDLCWIHFLINKKHLNVSLDCINDVFFLLLDFVYASNGECTDLHGRTILPGLHFVPGPDTCTLCVCENGNPKWCKAVLCSPPQECTSFRLGNSCCEFICLDDTLPKTTSDGTGNENGAEFGLRLIASAVTAILCLSLLFFLIHRLRQRKIRGRQNRQLTEDQRSLGSIGYIAGSLGYLPGSIGYLSNQDHIEFHYEEPPAHYPLWKPPGNYFPRGEAPPPYEEAVAAARAEAIAAASTLCDRPSGPGNQISGRSRHREQDMQMTEVIFGVPVGVGSTSGCCSGSNTMISSVDIDTRGSIPGTEEAIRSDAFYEDVAVLPSSLVDGAMASALHEGSSSVSSHPSVHVSGVLTTPSSSSAATLVASGNLGVMNDLNKSTCSCPDDNDDYRSECENCKSAHGSRYLDQLEPNIAPHETMTLQRRPVNNPQNAAHGYTTSLTLPSQSRRLRYVKIWVMPIMIIYVM